MHRTPWQSGASMYVGGMLLSYVAMVRTLVGAATAYAMATREPAWAGVVSVLAGLASVSYLVWLATRGRRELRLQPAPDPARRTVIGYAVLAMIVAPAAEWVVYRAFS